MEPLTAKEIAVFREMIQERLSREASPKKLHLKRDMTSTKTIRISTPLLERVMKENKDKNFSSLVERLLFEYLKCPEELVDK